MSTEVRRFATRRLYIEVLRTHHAALLFAPLSDARLYAYVDERPQESVAGLTRRYAQLERGATAASGETWLNWAIRLRRHPKYVGTLQATIYRDRAASIAYMLSPSHWKFGYATEAVQWLAGHLTTAFDVRELRASVDVRNEASWRLLERLRFMRIQTRAAELHGLPSTDYHYRLVGVPGAARRAKATRDFRLGARDRGS